MAAPSSSISTPSPDHVGEDGLIRTLDQAIQLPAFEGPLDLLLFLIRRNEIDIYDIPIENVTLQYLSILRNMKSLKLEVAGEFFVMAATLMQIKSRMLLPKEEQVMVESEEDEDIDPRWELVQQLIEYRKFKEASEDLSQLIDQANDFVYREHLPTTEDLPARPIRPTDRIELWNVFNQVLRRLSEKVLIGEIQADAVTVADRMEVVLKRMTSEKRFLFTDLFEEEGHTTVVMIVTTFLAILELTRMGSLSISQDTTFGDILCEAAERKEPPFSDLDSTEKV